MMEFSVMFPGLATELIESVLRSNKGAVDDTIDQLLSMNTVNPEKETADTDALTPVGSITPLPTLSIPPSIFLPLSSSRSLI